MSYPAKTKGYRSISVEGVRYRWRFVAGKDDGTVTLQGGESGGQQAVVTLRDAGDPWLALSEGKARFFVVSPKLVRSMVTQALAAGWEPGKRGAAVKLDFRPIGVPPLTTLLPFKISEEVKQWLLSIPPKPGREPGFSCAHRYVVFKGNEKVEEYTGDHYNVGHMTRAGWMSQHAISVLIGERVFWILPDILDKLQGNTLTNVEKNVGLGKQTGKTRKFLLAV